jgi:two-component system, NtrC family, response regulator
MTEEQIPRRTQTIEAQLPPAEGCLLRVVEGDDRGLELDLPSGEAIIGKDAGCGLRLADSTVSGRHLRVVIVRGGIEVTDLASRNGTFYLDTRLDRAIVPLGAVVRAGRTRIGFVSRQEGAGPGLSDRDRYGRLLGGSTSMRRLFAALEQIERADYPVLIFGETGVGKELVAQEIHAHSARSARPIEICDSTSIPSGLAESALFGHVRGAFTGAVSDHAGVFERAHDGTLFIDEIGELPLALQPKLLRVLEAREIRRLGDSKSRTVDVRVIAATNRDLAEEVRAGRFREDLFHRLNIIFLEVPPLRARRDDIPMIVRAFLEEHAERDLALSPSTIEHMTTGYDWPGNVRELRNAVLSVLAFGRLPKSVEAAEPGSEPPAALALDEAFQAAKRRVIDAFERDYLAAQLDRAEGNIARAARRSNVERTQFKRLLRKHGMLKRSDG